MQRKAQRQRLMVMREDRVITDEAKYNFFALLKKLGHPHAGLHKELGLDHSIYDHFLTRRPVRNRGYQALILYLLDFGVKCDLEEAIRLQDHLLEYCSRRILWEETFKFQSIGKMISDMELDWTWKLTKVIHNLRDPKTDINYRLKYLLLEINQVILVFVDL